MLTNPDTELLLAILFNVCLACPATGCIAVVSASPYLRSAVSTRTDPCVDLTSLLTTSRPADLTGVSAKQKRAWPGRSAGIAAMAGLGAAPRRSKRLLCFEGASGARCCQKFAARRRGRARRTLHAGCVGSLYKDLRRHPQRVVRSPSQRLKDSRCLRCHLHACNSDNGSDGLRTDTCHLSTRLVEDEGVPLPSVWRDPVRKTTVHLPITHCSRPLPTSTHSNKDHLMVSGLMA